MLREPRPRRDFRIAWAGLRLSAVRSFLLRTQQRLNQSLSAETETFAESASDSAVRDPAMLLFKGVTPLLEETHERTGDLLHTIDDEESRLKQK